MRPPSRKPSDSFGTGKVAENKSVSCDVFLMAQAGLLRDFPLFRTPCRSRRRDKICRPLQPRDDGFALWGDPFDAGGCADRKRDTAERGRSGHGNRSEAGVMSTAVSAFPLRRSFAVRSTYAPHSRIGRRAAAPREAWSPRAKARSIVQSFTADSFPHTNVTRQSRRRR